MTRDYIGGLLLSGLLHVAVLFIDRSSDPNSSSLKKEDDPPTLFLVPTIPVEEELQEPGDTSTDKSGSPDRAPGPEIPRSAEPVVTAVVDIQTHPFQPLRPQPQIVAAGFDPRVISESSGGGGRGLKSFSLDELQEAPIPRFQAKPIYPFEMRRNGLEGAVLVGFVVTSTGDVRDAYSIRSTRAEFEAAAIAAVSKWKFRPGRKDGRAVNTRMQVPMQFTINTDS